MYYGECILHEGWLKKTHEAENSKWMFHKVSEDILQSDIPKLYPSINWFFFFFYKIYNISEKDAVKLASLAAQ